MDALFSAFAPSVATSLSSGASGALEGQMAGEDRVLKNDLLKAQTEWQRAHAANYGHLQRAAAQAMGSLQEGLKRDPNFLNTDYGRFLSTAAGHFDLAKNNAGIQANTALAGQRDQHGNYFGAQTETENQLRQPRVYAQNELGNMRGAAADQTDALTDPKVREVNSRTALNQARKLSEGSLKTLRDYQGILAQDRSAHAKALTANAKAGGGHALNLYSYADTLASRIQDALEAQANGQGDGPDPNLVMQYEDVRMKLRGPDYGIVPLGGDVVNRRTGEKPTAEVPEKSGLFGFGKEAPKPATPPAMKPTDLTPRRSKVARPGSAEYDQSVLKARKVLKDRGKSFVESQLKTNKALTPTEKLALQEALLSEGVGE